MKALIFFSLLLSVIFSSNTIKLNSSPEIDLIYSFPSVDTIEFTLQFFTQGYVAIGFGTTMSNSQIYLAYKTQTGAFTIESTHKVPTPDAQQNLVFVSGSRDSSKTVVTFQRKLDTGNSVDVTLVQGVAYDLIWAYGADDTLIHHVAHGYQSVTFTPNVASRFRKIIMDLQKKD